MAAKAPHLITGILSFKQFFNTWKYDTFNFSDDDNKFNSRNKKSYSAVMGDPTDTKEKSSVVDKKNKY
jgi:hypothetical protein